MPRAWVLDQALQGLTKPFVGSVHTCIFAAECGMQLVCGCQVCGCHKRWLTSCTPGHMLPCRVLEPEVFSSLRKLQELRLDDNAVRTIYPAMGVSGGLQACFPRLRVLQLSNNRLLDPSECANRIAAIPLLAEVAVSGNPFTRKHHVSCPCPSTVDTPQPAATWSGHSLWPQCCHE